MEILQLLSFFSILTFFRQLIAMIIPFFPEDGGDSDLFFGQED